jgi:serine-type D-Ala-D-Ala carboxypeptidase/endopeptidase (penicillin-binding protein 4)
VRTAIVAAVLALASQATAGPPSLGARKLADPKHLGANARVSFANAGGLRMPAEIVPRRAEPLTPEEQTAAQIQKLLRGPLLRNGVTGLFVADARTGETLFSVNADDPLNPASNVKMISTATAIDLLGPDFRYPTRVLGPTPVDGVVHGDVYLLGSHDPTLAVADFDDIAVAMAGRGITAIEGDVLVGSDPTRDGVYRAVVPVEITAGEPGKPPIVSVPDGFDLVSFNVTARTSDYPHLPRLAYRATTGVDEHGQPHITLAVAGAIGRGQHTEYQLWTEQRRATAGYALLAALRAHSIALTGTLSTRELGVYVGDTVAAGALPVELGRHDSDRIADIVARVNKWSINWLADRVVMTAAALAHQQPPSMELALESMYAWLARNAHVGKGDVVIDTGSGLSYRTQITPKTLVSVIRSAGGFTKGDPDAARAWLHSLSVGGTDGTLQYRFRGDDMRGRVIAKTGSLSTVIALSGILEIDPARPLAFSLVTNTDTPLEKPYVRRAHEQVVGEICRYIAQTAKRPVPVSAKPAEPLPAAAPVAEEGEPTPQDKALDAETARKP